MELCTGGSLYEVIDSPEHACGLDETQFKQLIYDVGQFLTCICLNVGGVSFSSFICICSI